MKELIDKLIKKYGTISEVGRVYSVNRQTLDNWRKNRASIKKALDFVDKAKKDLAK